MPWDLSKVTEKSLAKMFDYAILPKQTTKEEIIKGAELCIEYNFACYALASGYWVPLCVDILKGTDVMVGAAIGFPFGVATGYAKAKETEEAVAMGSTSLDTVMNIGALLSNQFDVVKEELRLFKDACQGEESKCIIEVCYLPDDYIVAACEMIAEAGLNFVKTSSGQYEGPTLEQARLVMKTIEGTGTKMKVSGVKFPRPQNAYAFMLAGADRIGTRAAPEILKALPQMREIGLVPPYQP